MVCFFIVEELGADGWESADEKKQNEKNGAGKRDGHIEAG